MGIKLKKKNNSINSINIIAYSTENPVGNKECVINNSCGGGAADMVCSCNGSSGTENNNINFDCVMSEDFTSEILTNYGCTNTSVIPEGTDMSNFGCQ